MPAASALSVLIVDDQLTIRTLVRSGLNQIGVTNTREAGDGEEAVQSLVRRPAHLVITDYNMPKLDGLGLLRAIRTYEPIRNTAVIMLTGRADPELVQRAAQFGVNNYLVKPFTVATLRGKIEDVFGALT
jgi:two-component system chemotaxis response regulator CheY